MDAMSAVKLPRKTSNLDSKRFRLKTFLATLGPDPLINATYLGSHRGVPGPTA